MEGLYRELVEILRANGWTKQRSGKGSHEIWTGPTGIGSLSVPRTMKSRHTANGILKQAGLPKAF